MELQIGNGRIEFKIVGIRTSSPVAHKNSVHFPGAGGLIDHVLSTPSLGLHHLIKPKRTDFQCSCLANASSVPRG